MGGGGVGAGVAAAESFAAGAGVARTAAVLGVGVLAAGVLLSAGVAAGDFVEAIDFAPVATEGRGVEAGSSVLRLFAAGVGVVRALAVFGSGVLIARGFNSVGAGVASGRGVAGGASVAWVGRVGDSGFRIVAARFSEFRKYVLRAGGAGGRDFSHSSRFIGSLDSSELSNFAVSPSARTPGKVSAAAKAILKRNLPEG